MKRTIGIFLSVLMAIVGFDVCVSQDSRATSDDYETDYDSITATYPYYAFVENPDEPWGTVWDALDATDTIEYSDGYFDVPSPGDHPELRAVSYALALAGFENGEDGYSPESSTPNLKLRTFLNYNPNSGAY